MVNGQVIAGGGNHSIFICSDSTVRGWGANGFGQLGDSSTTQRITPVKTKLLTHVISVAAGNNYSVALKDDGTVWACGYNFNYELGDGTITSRKIPVQVHDSSNTGFLTDIISISCRGWHTLALKNDSTVWAWGHSNWGALGIGYPMPITTVPVLVHGSGDIGFLSGIIAVAAGGVHSLALRSDSTVWAWGQGSHGELGVGPTINMYSPVQVHGPGDVGFLTGIVAIAAGATHSLALKNDGTLWSWGDNSFGQLGDGSTTQRNTPVQVAGLTGIISIQTQGWLHSIALRNDSTIWAWGRNNLGQLGTGDTIQWHIPVQIASSPSGDAITVVAGHLHSLGLNGNGEVWTWGSNLTGQLGDGTTIDRWTPVQVTNACVIVGMQELSSQTEPFLSPVPNSGSFTITLPQSMSEAAISIYNLMGEKVFERDKGQGTGDKGVVRINLSNVPAGIYFVRVSDGEKMFVRKIIKQ